MSQELEAARSRLDAVQPSDSGTANAQVPGWTQLLAAFAAAVASDAAHAAQQAAAGPVDARMNAAPAASEQPAMAPVGEAVRRVQLWAQAMREEQLAWDASATTTGGTSS